MFSVSPDTYLDLKKRIIDAGYADEIDWADEVKAPHNSVILAYETIFVICNSGMKYQIAVQIFKKVIDAIKEGVPVKDVFKNKNKARAIQSAWDERDERFDIYESLQTDEEKIKYFETLDGLGKITKFHLAKNCGLEVFKPDRHIVRIADNYGMTPSELCEGLAERLGERIGVVDLVLWRAANLGWI